MDLRTSPTGKRSRSNHFHLRAESFNLKNASVLSRKGTIMESNSGHIETEERKADSDVFVVLGIVFIGTGTALGTTINTGLHSITFLGLVFLLVGLAKRRKSE